ncbi:MAG TPA: L-lactate permease [Candidatus Saccharimonadales bacterium]|jgi:lactate permease|nr:L-lactate permease [Candidatus Saccharimonadales bacterium]
MNWTQVYDPLGHWWLSTLVAALPIVVLLGLLAGFRVRPHLAALAGAGAALVCAVFVFHMPVGLASMSFLYGLSFGLLKIVWIVVAGVFVYELTVFTGDFEIMKESLAGVTADRRLQLLLVAFCFGAFLEGCAGFGTPVAIAGAFMVGLGFTPFYAATLNLIANTAPVAWGAIGTPVHTLAAVTQLPESDVNAMIGRILPITCVIVPFWLVKAMVSWRETFEVLPAILVVGLSFGSMQFYWANHRDSNLVDITAGLFSLLITILFLHFWKPKTVWRFPEEQAASGGVLPERHSYSGGRVIKAWMPFIILSLFVFLWGYPPVKKVLNTHTTPAFSKGGWDFPYLHKAISRDVPVVAKPTAEAAKYDFNWFTATGTACFLAGIVSGLLLGVSFKNIFKVFGATVYKLRFAIIAIGCMLGLGFLTRYSGMDAVLGLAFTRTGWLFPFFGTFLGWLGVALTGSDTSSNALFGSLQSITAKQLNLSPVLMAAANSAGGVMGKMVDAQSICVATAATNQVGNEGPIFRWVFWHSVMLASVVGIIVMLYAYKFTWAIPHGLTFIK